MTKLLEKAYKRALKLPPAEQNAVAACWLVEMDSDEEWERLFAEHPEMLDKLAADARQAIARGETEAMDFERLKPS